MKTTKVNFVSDYSKSPNLLDDRCVACKGSHSLAQCGQFKEMRPYQRLQLVRRNHLCFGCLSKSHMLATCDKSRTCNVDGCNSKHSVWLHVNLMIEHVTFDVSLLNDNVICNVANDCVVTDLPSDVSANGISLDDGSHLTNSKVDLLIGQDQPDLLVPLEICRSMNKAGQPYATRTKLGWALQGVVDEQIGCKACMMTNDIESETESTLSWSGEDQRVYDMWQGKTEPQCNMHQVVFPWRPGRLC